MNMYYTFSQADRGRSYTIKDIASIILGHNPVQLVINDKCVWDDKYDDNEAYDKAIETFSDHVVKELWISIVEDHHSIVKITTQENNNGT